MEVEGEGEVWHKQFCVFPLRFQRRRMDGEVGHIPLVLRAPPFPLLTWRGRERARIPFLDSQPETGSLVFLPHQLRGVTHSCLEVTNVSWES